MIAAEYHNGRACTFDGRDTWIACLVGRPGLMWATLRELATEQEAIEYLDMLLTIRDLHGVKITRTRAAGDEPGIDYTANRRPMKGTNP